MAKKYLVDPAEIKEEPIVGQKYRVGIKTEAAKATVPNPAGKNSEKRKRVLRRQPKPGSGTFECFLWVFVVVKILSHIVCFLFFGVLYCCIVVVLIMFL